MLPSHHLHAQNGDELKSKWLFSRSREGVEHAELVGLREKEGSGGEGAGENAEETAESGVSVSSRKHRHKLKLK
jgi:hypothetical protein